MVSSNMEETGNLFMYFTQGVAATEVEVDTLNGDHTVLRVDIHVYPSILGSTVVLKSFVVDGRRQILESRHRLWSNVNSYLNVLMI